MPGSRCSSCSNGSVTSPNLTAEVYTHLMRERLEEGRERMERYMQRRRCEPAQFDVREADGRG